MALAITIVWYVIMGALATAGAMYRVRIPDEDMHRHAAENIAQADALLFRRVTYEKVATGRSDSRLPLVRECSGD
ncbi:MAG TPA: hypothetical protein VFK70_01080 [Vicinamibacteria bacterium]|nr:hypothetical protein [Vicinamibacteria bacterium]